MLFWKPKKNKKLWRLEITWKVLHIISLHGNANRGYVCYLTSGIFAIIKITKITNAGEDVMTRESYTLFRGMQITHSGAQYGCYSTIKSKSIMWPCYLIPGYTSEGNESACQSNTYTPVFIVALFTIAKIWSHLNSQLMDEWIKKILLKHTQTHTQNGYY